VVRSLLVAEPKLANRRFKPPDSDALPPALQVVAAAKEVSHPDNYRGSYKEGKASQVVCCPRQRPGGVSAGRS
ncbi:hypothetical protein ACETIH_22515, partial [Microvirga arabica]